MTLAAFGAVAFSLALVLMWQRKTWRRTQSVLMVVAGLSASGAVGGLQNKIAGLAHDASVSSTTKVLGTAVPFVFAFVIVTVWALQMDFDGLVNKARGKGGSGKGLGGLDGLLGKGKGGNRHTVTRWTPWLGLLVPVAIAALPGLGELPDHARQGVAQLASMIG